MALSGDGSGDLHAHHINAENSTINIGHHYYEPVDDRSQVIAKKGRRVPGTCEWLTHHPTYVGWLKDVKSHILWLSGGPGKGKTMISIYLTEELEKSARTSHETVLYYFCDNADNKRNSAIAVLRSLLYQLLKQQSQLFKYALDEFNAPNKAQYTLSSLDALWRIFASMLRDSGVGTVFCIIDGLDECDESSLEPFLKKLKDFFSSARNEFSTVNFKLLLVSRDRPTCIETQLREFNRVKLDPDANNEVNGDIESYTSLKMSELAKEGHLSENALGRAREALIKGAEGTFLWIGFVADELKGKPESEVEEVLRSVPSGLDGIYRRMLQQIERKRRETVALILQWVVVSQRPLTLTELSAATNTKGSNNQSCESIMEDRLKWCGLLLKVENDVVNFVHQSAKDYLQRDEPYDETLDIYRIKRKDAHLVAAKTCFDYVQRGPSICYYREWRNTRIHSELLQEYPLLDYAALYWPEHAKCAANAIEDIFDFSDPFCKAESKARQNWWSFYWDSTVFFGRAPTSFTLMHVAAYFGIVPLAQKLIMKNRWRSKLPSQNLGNEKDSSGWTPLSYAALEGHEAMVKLLLETGKVKADSKDNYGQTPLSHAAGEGHEAMVKLLLETGKAKADSKDNDGQTPLSYAAGGGKQAMVKLLLETGKVKADSKDNYGQTPLSYAALLGQEAVVKLLLETGKVEADSKSKNGRTPLSYTAEKGHMAVAKLLLETGKVEADSKDHFGRTPLSYAAKWGHVAVVELLLGIGEVEADSKDNFGRTPLSYAAGEGKEATVWLLLKTGKVEIDSKDNKNWTPLSYAADRGRETVMRLFKTVSKS